MKDELYAENKELFGLTEEISKFARLLLKGFNSKKLNLLELPAHKRICLFFLARAIKTYSAIELLCQEGYGQDVSTLLRSLLENLISLKYILYEPSSSDEKAVRFVEYKWVIFKRYLPQEEKKQDSYESESFLEKGMIMDKFKEYKQKYNISSDKALISWSGKSVRDMAKLVDKNLLREYELTFRLCSRFSHPSIIGDKEYLDYQNNILTFSPFPSSIGITPNLKSAINYLYDFLYIFNDLFNLNSNSGLQDLNKKIARVFQMEKYNKPMSFKKSISGLDKEHKEKILLKFNGIPAD